MHVKTISETLYLVPLTNGCGDIPSEECFTIKYCGMWIYLGMSYLILI